jgi:hypothetical protein
MNGLVLAAISDSRLYTVWAIVLVIAAVIILVVALLLTLIWLATCSIERYALRSLAAAQQIVDNTKPIWELQETNRVAGLLLEEAQQIARVGTALADAIGGTPGPDNRT